MDMLEYQHQAHKTSLNTTIGDGPLALVNYPAMKLAGEAGEVAEKVAKIHRDKGGFTTPEDLLGLKKELGDVLWYVAEIAHQLDIDLDDVARTNIEKLASRLARGKIGGSGDNR